MGIIKNRMFFNEVITMIELRKLTVFIFVAFLLIYMLYITFYCLKKFTLRKSLFFIMILGLGLITAATFLDMISNFTNGRYVVYIRLFFTSGAILFIIGIVMWGNYIKKTLSVFYENARTDPMTGVYNRKGIEEAFERAVKKREKFYIMSFDLDGTKVINDNFGHLIGDKYIMSAVKIILEEIGDGGVLGRFGGDEFVAIIEKIDEEIKEKIKNSIKQRVSCIFPDKSTRISIGYSLYGRDGKSLKQLLKSSDIKMYEDKKIGRSASRIN